MFAEGTHSIGGSVDLPEGTSSGRFVQIILERTGSSPFTEESTAGLTTDSDRIDFAIGGLSDGTYLVRLRVDATGNTRFRDAGDIGGDSGEIVIDGESVEGITFEADIIP